MNTNENNESASNEKVNRDAVAGTKKNAQLPPLSSVPIPVKKGIEWFQREAGIANMGEATAVLIASILGETIKFKDRDESDEAAEAIGKRLFESPAVKSVLALYESERKARKDAAAREAQLAKLKEMGFTLDEIKAALS